MKTLYTVMIPKHVGNRVEVKLFDGRQVIIEFDENDIFIGRDKRAAAYSWRSTSLKSEDAMSQQDASTPKRN